MSSRRERREKKIQKIKLIIVCCFVFALGYYLLDIVSRIYEIPLGGTFYVITGGVLMAASGVYIGYTINELFFKKKPKKRSKPTFLDENYKNPKS